MTKSVLVLGDINVDIIGKFDVFPTPGSSTYSDRPTLRPGGSGLNTFVGLKKLEIDADFVTMIGKDLFGSFIKEELSELGMSDQEAMQESRRCLRCDHFGFGVFKGGRIERW